MRQGKQQAWSKRLDSVRNFAPGTSGPNTEKRISIVNRQHMDLLSITEGKLVAEDIISQDGKLLLAYGTKLTRPLIMRLIDLTEFSAVKARLLVGDAGN